MTCFVAMRRCDLYSAAMAQTRDPALSPDSELWKSLDWLVEDRAVAPSLGRWARFTSAIGLGPAAPPPLSKKARLMIGAIGVAVVASGTIGWRNLSAREIPTPIAPPVRTTLPHIDAPFAPDAIRDLSPDEALAWNAAAASDAAETIGASAFVLDSPQATDYQRSLDCLTQAIHYEAGSEEVDGGRAVAQVVLNRVRHPAYPNTVCGVVFEGAKRTTGCQFTFACDGSLARAPSPRAWARARAIAVSALAGDVYAPVGWSTHYHANYVVPYWASSLHKTATVGAHIFYRWTGNWGQASAFNSKYAGAEPLAALLMGSESALAATETETGESTSNAAAVPLTQARPVLLTAARDAVAPVAKDAAVREVGLGDRKILIQPEAAASEAMPPAS